LRDTAVTSGMIYFILFGAEVIKSFFSRAGLPAALADWAAASTLDPWFILVVMLLLLILLGCFMESLSMILVVVPFFWPALIMLNGGDYVSVEASAYGMGTDDLKIWFGILALVVVERSHHATGGAECFYYQLAGQKRSHENGICRGHAVFLRRDYKDCPDHPVSGNRPVSPEIVVWIR